jgi:protein TonB
VHVEHCIARLIEQGTLHCDPAAEPVPVVQAEPSYPEAARAQRIRGWVELEARVSPAGAPESPRVAGAEPPGFFEEAALRAFRRWRYCPKAHRGKAIRALMRFSPTD